MKSVRQSTYTDTDAIRMICCSVTILQVASQMKNGNSLATQAVRTPEYVRLTCVRACTARRLISSCMTRRWSHPAISRPENHARRGSRSLVPHRFPPGNLPAEPDAQTDLALARGAEDFREAVQVANRAVGVQPQVRDVSAGIPELRPIEHVERLEPDLQTRVARHPELPEHAEVPVVDAGTSEHAPRRGAEPRLGNRLESKRIEVSIAAADAAEDLDLRVDLVGALTASR